MDGLDAAESFIRMNLLADRSRLPVIDPGYTQLSLLPSQPLLMESEWHTAYGADSNTTGLPDGYGYAGNNAGTLLLPTREDTFASVTGEL